MKEENIFQNFFGFYVYWYGAGARPSHRLWLWPAPDPTGTGSTTLFVTQFFEHLFLPAVANYCTSVCLSVCRCNCSWWNTLAATRPAEHSPSVGSSTRLGKWGKFLLVQPNTAFRYLIYWYRYFFLCIPEPHGFAIFILFLVSRYRDTCF